MLVVVHPNGWIETYAERHVDVRIATMLRMTTPAGERLAQEYLELTLPKRYRALYEPSNRRAADMVRTITPQDIAQKKWDMEMIETVDAIAARGKGEVTTWVA